MKCPTCGAEVQPGQRYCPSCGALQTTDQAWGGVPVPSAAAENRDITKSEFCRTYAPDKVRKNIKGSAILCYFSAVVTAVVGILFSPLMLVDAAIVLVLGLAIHLKQSRVCAVLLLVYSLISCLSVMLQTGRPGSWLIILAGVFAVMNTFKLEKEYRAFRGE